MQKFFTLIFILSLALNIYCFVKNTFWYSIIYHNSTKKLNQNNLIQAKVVRVIDGDTFDIDNGNRIRLYEINAPEYPSGCLGIEAKERLANLILDKKINYQTIKKDNFGRILTYIYVDDMFINKIMLEEGLADFDKQTIYQKESFQLEKASYEAERVKRGIYSSLCLNQKPGCLIKGNYRSSTKTRIYHTSDCYNYDKIIIKPGTSDRWFCSEEEATRAGFVKSKDCP